MTKITTQVTNSAGGVVINKEGLILVVNQRHKSWSLPKGHVEKGEDILQAAKREIHEESGITDLKLIKNLGSYKRYRMNGDGSDYKKELKRIHFFLFTTNQEKLKPLDKNNPEARWVKKTEVTKMLSHKKDIEFFLKFLKENEE